MGRKKGAPASFTALSCATGSLSRANSLDSPSRQVRALGIEDLHEHVSDLSFAPIWCRPLPKGPGVLGSWVLGPWVLTKLSFCGGEISTWPSRIRGSNANQFKTTNSGYLTNANMENRKVSTAFHVFEGLRPGDPLHKTGS